MKDEGMFIGWKEGWNKDLTRSWYKCTLHGFSRVGYEGNFFCLNC
jgi:hypothetical protein